MGWDLFLQLRGQLFLMQDEPGAVEAIALSIQEANLRRMSQQQQMFHVQDNENKIDKPSQKVDNGNDGMRPRLGRSSAPPLFRRSSSRLSRASSGSARHRAADGGIDTETKGGSALGQRTSSSVVALTGGPPEQSYEASEAAVPVGTEASVALRIARVSQSPGPGLVASNSSDHPPADVRTMTEQMRGSRVTQSSPTRSAAGLSLRMSESGTGASEDGGRDQIGQGGGASTVFASTATAVTTAVARSALAGDAPEKFSASAVRVGSAPPLSPREGSPRADAGKVVTHVGSPSGGPFASAAVASAALDINNTGHSSSGERWDVARRLYR